MEQPAADRCIICIGVGSNGQLWINGLYDSLCVFLFPFIVYTSAPVAKCRARWTGQLARFWEIFLPAVYYSLPVYLFVYGMGAKHEAYIKTSAGFYHDGMHGNRRTAGRYPAGLCLLKIVWCTGEGRADEKV